MFGLLNPHDLIVKFLEQMGADKVEEIVGPPQSGEAIIIENLDESDVKPFNDSRATRREANDLAQRLYLLMKKAESLRTTFWAELKLKYKEAYKADQNGISLGLRQLSNGKYVLVTIPNENEKTEKEEENNAETDFNFPFEDLQADAEE